MMGFDSKRCSYSGELVAARWSSSGEKTFEGGGKSGSSKNTSARILFPCIPLVTGTVMACMTLRLNVPVFFDAIATLSVLNHLMVGAHLPRYSNEQLNVNISPTGTSEVRSGCVQTGSAPVK